MPSGSFRQADIRCPYYKWDNGKNRISCEGIIPDSQIQNFFRRPTDLSAQVRVFCTGCYEKCEVAAVLEQRYKEEEYDE